MAFCPFQNTLIDSHKLIPHTHTLSFQLFLLWTQCCVTLSPVTLLSTHVCVCGRVEFTHSDVMKRWRWEGVDKTGSWRPSLLSCLWRCWEAWTSFLWQQQWRDDITALWGQSRLSLLVCVCVLLAVLAAFSNPRLFISHFSVGFWLAIQRHTLIM